MCERVLTISSSLSSSPCSIKYISDHISSLSTVGISSIAASYTSLPLHEVGLKQPLAPLHETHTTW